MALTNEQLVTVAEITRELFSTVENLAVDLLTAQEDSIIADLATWATIRDSHVKLLGGKDGIDLDNERKREAIRQRIRKMLGLSLISEEWLNLQPDVMQLIDLEVGRHFG
jgi:hypothetical protein